MMTNLLSPSECGVRKHHLPLTAHGFKMIILHYVTLCFIVGKLFYSSLCYIVLCRITNGPFDQEVVNSSLTLEDPDLKVKESTSLALRFELSNWKVTPSTLCDKRSHSKHQTLF